MRHRTSKYPAHKGAWRIFVHKRSSRENMSLAMTLTVTRKLAVDTKKSYKWNFFFFFDHVVETWLLLKVWVLFLCRFSENEVCFTVRANICKYCHKKAPETQKQIFSSSYPDPCGKLKSSVKVRVLNIVISLFGLEDLYKGAASVSEGERRMQATNTSGVWCHPHCFSPRKQKVPPLHWLLLACFFFFFPSPPPPPTLSSSFDNHIKFSWLWLVCSAPTIKLCENSEVRKDHLSPVVNKGLFY